MKRIHPINLVCIAALAATAIADTTIDEVHSYACGANTGWINAAADGTNGAVIGQNFCSGYLWSGNCGWISLGDGDPDDGMAYGNDSAADFGVNHDGRGNLTGYAYGANIGWINFEQTNGQPKVNLETGDVSGYVWSAGTGWIRLDGLVTLSIDTGPDADADGIPDAWEYSRCGQLNGLGLTPSHDRDGDGVSDVDEYLADTDPFNETDYLKITDFQIWETTNMVTWMCEPTRLYTLQYCAALSNGMSWADTGSSFVPPFSGEIGEMVTGVCDTNRFYRVLAEPPLRP